MALIDEAREANLRFLQDAIAKHQNGKKKAAHPPQPLPKVVTNGHTPKPSRVLSDMDQWKVRVAKIIEADCEKAGNLTFAHTDPEKLVDSSTSYALTVIEQSGLHPPESTDVQLEVRHIASGVVQGYIDKYLPVNGNGHVPAEIGDREVVLWENADQAMVSNAEYLSREAIVDRLYYEQAISLTVGGKHEGKTTNTRTEALAIAAGEEVYGRRTSQTPVVYASSDDEYPTTRMELLRMGWQRRRLPLMLMKIKTSENPEPEEILAQIARRAEIEGARYIVLDMLFDFIRVQDEIKYAQTRAAIGHIQTLADETRGHAKATHHSPKWMPDAATAAKAALGSQGIVAKFSPIILCRKWADDLYTVESTTTRDPRGEAIKPLCIVRDENGWARPNGEFKSWMKWPAYAERILGLFEGGEEGKRMSVSQVMEAIELSRAETQNALYQMTVPRDGKPGALSRQKVGKKYLYFLYEKELFGGDPG